MTAKSHRAGDSERGLMDARGSPNGLRLYQAATIARYEMALLSTANDEGTPLL